MTSPFEKTENWIERGPDGHNFYVRKKQQSGLPSFKAIFREAIHDLIHGPSPFWKDFKRANRERSKSNPATAPFPPYVFPQLVNNPLPPNISRVSLASSIRRNLPPPVMQPPQDDQNNNNTNQPRGILKPEQQRFSAGPNGGPPMSGWTPTAMPLFPPQPYPGMHPGAIQGYGGYPPQTGYNGHPQVFHPMQNHMPNTNIPRGPTQSPGGFQGLALPPDARAISPPRYPTQDDLKYKCAICGRFRSTRYHYEHPLAPGQLPGTTICRRCRNTETDSEDEATESDDSHGSTRRHRRESRHAHRSSFGRSRSRRSRRRRSPGPTQGRIVWTDDDEYDDYEPRSRVRTLSRSGSQDGLRRARSRSILRRRRSPSVEEVEYVRQPRTRPTRRIVYVEDDPAYFSGPEEEEVEVRTVRRMPRSATPGIRRHNRQSSDPGRASPRIQDEVEPFGEPSTHRISSRRPPQSFHQGSYQGYSSGTEQDWYGNGPPRRASRSMSRSRRGDQDHGVGQAHVDTTSQPFTASHPDRNEERVALMDGKHGDKGLGSSSSPFEAGLLSHDTAHQYLTTHNTRAMEERSSSNDYDWYDDTGMRVRVREI